MKIALYHNLPLGGALNIEREFETRLASAGHVVDTYRLASEEDRDSSRNTYTFSLGGNAPNLLRKPLPLIDVYRLLLLSKRIAKDIDSLRYDVVLTLACRYLQGPSILAYLATPSVYYCTEPFRFFYEPRQAPWRKPSLRKDFAYLIFSPVHFVLKWLDRKFVRKASSIFTHSQFIHDQIRTVYGRNSSICRLGIDADKYGHIQNVRKQNFALSIGRITWQKGHEDAIRAIGRIDSCIRPALKVIGQVGSADEIEFLDSLATDLDVSVEFLVDKVDDEALVRLYNAAKVTLCFAFDEPFGLTPLESMSCGTPVVAVDQGGFRETVINGMNGYLVPRNHVTMAERIREVLMDEKHASIMGAQGRTYVKDGWSWQLSINDIEAVLRRTAAGRSGTGESIH